MRYILRGPYHYDAAVARPRNHGPTYEMAALREKEAGTHPTAEGVRYYPRRPYSYYVCSIDLFITQIAVFNIGLSSPSNPIAWVSTPLNLVRNKSFTIIVCTLVNADSTKYIPFCSQVFAPNFATPYLVSVVYISSLFCRPKFSNQLIYMF